MLVVVARGMGIGRGVGRRSVWWYGKRDIVGREEEELGEKI